MAPVMYWKSVGACLRLSKSQELREGWYFLTCRYDNDTAHHSLVVPPGLILTKCQAHVLPRSRLPFPPTSAHAMPI